METFKPTEINNGEYGTMLVKLHECPICKKTMIVKPSEPFLGSTDGPFPIYHKVNFDAQIKVAGWDIVSHSSIDSGAHICKTCESEGKSNFECAFCKVKRSTLEIQESFGYSPSSHLCVPCYTTVPAADWDKEVERLTEAHRYDFM